MQRRSLVRPSLRVFAILLAFAVVAAACGNSDDEGSQDQPQSTETTVPVETAEEPMDDSRTDLVVAYGEDTFQSDDGNLKRLGRYPINTQICEPLVRLTEDFQVGPGLATDWSFSGGTFDFTLREGVTFSDGTPLTADDVVYSLEALAAEPSVTENAKLVPGSSSATGDLGVALTPDVENLRLVEQTAHPTYSVFAVGSDPAVAPVCTGPFMLDEYSANESISVVRNDRYWGEPALLETIDFLFIPDETTRALALQEGSVDLIADIDRSQAASLDAMDGIKVVQSPTGQVIMMYIKLRGVDGAETITSDLAVRQAIALSIDQNLYVDGVLDGFGEAVETVAPPLVLGDQASTVTGYPFDPDEAGRILDAAGWVRDGDGTRLKDGAELTIDLRWDPVRLTVPTAEFVAANLTDVGFDVNIITDPDRGTWRDEVRAGNYDVNIEAPNQNDANPAFLLALRWYSGASNPGAPFVMPGIDSEFDSLIAQTFAETDYDSLKALAAEAMHQLVDVEVAAVALAGTTRLYAMNEDIEGFVAHPSGINQQWSSVFWATG